MNDRITARRVRCAPDTSRLTRRAERLLACGLLTTVRGELVVGQASSPGELCEAYRLVHDVFVEQGYIDPHPSGMRIRSYELCPKTSTFVARIDGKLVGVMSVVPDSREQGLPSDAAFQHELESLRRPTRRLVEISNLAVLREHRNTTVFLELARCITAHVMNEGCDDAFVAVSPHHALFFEGILRFEPWGKRRPYRPGGEDIVQGCRSNIGRFESELRAVDAALGARAFLHAWFFEQNPFFEITRRSAPSARARFVEEDARAKLLRAQSSDVARRAFEQGLRRAS